MKISELITFSKRTLTPCGNGYTKYKYLESGFRLEFAEKNGYYYNISAHSRFERLLTMNYDKDCVVAYLKGKFSTFFLIKAKNYYGFILLHKEMWALKGQSIFDINYIKDKELMNVFNEYSKDLKIVNKEDYEKLKRTMLLDALNKEGEEDGN